MNFTSNPQLQLAFDFVETTSRNIFLTGKAGTGKTTFLHNLKRVSSKRMVVVAPTGVAAINAGGVTIHSFFQLPFGPQLPNAPEVTERTTNQFFRNESRIQRFSRNKIDIIKSIDLLIIDEVSMVRADLLDGIDGVLRRFRNRSKPFGGVQLLMIGDLQQLAPIAKNDEWAILKQYYDTVFFFSSKALQQTTYMSIELKYIFRQSDENFINLLNKVRNNKLDDEGIALLNQHHVPRFSPDEKEGYITLTTHNYQAQTINNEKLNALNTKPKTFTAVVEGDFPEHAYPTNFELTLKEGAQVMFVKNDPSHEKLFFNGKIGTLEGFDDDIIYVQCPDDPYPIAVTPLIWENTKYTIDHITKEIKEDVAGKFIQYPLKLAWAITIHKSQGLTFEKAIIDAQAAFAHGQVYVALSRCKSLEGMVLSTPIVSHSIINDQTVLGFNKKVESNHPSPEQLAESQLAFQKELILDLFNFSLIQRQLGYTLRFINDNSTSFQPDLPTDIASLSQRFKVDICDVADKFILQIVRLVSEHSAVEKNATLQERLKKSTGYFIPKLDDDFLAAILNANTETDSKEFRSKINEHIEKVSRGLNEKIMCMKACVNGFKVKHFIKIRAEASIETFRKKKSAKADSRPTISSTKYPEMYQRLKAYRDKLAHERDVPVYRIIPQKTMLEIANELPYHKSLLKKIKGLGKKKISEFGDDIVEMAIKFRKEMLIPIPEGEIFEEEKPKPKKEKSHLITFRLFQEGMDVKQIAKERGFAESTIGSHLIPYIGSKELHIEKLMPQSAINEISKYFFQNKTSSLSSAWDYFNQKYSYNELKWVEKHLQTNEKLKEFDGK